MSDSIVIFSIDSKNYAVVDEGDWPLVSQFRWWPVKRKRNGTTYLRARIPVKPCNSYNTKERIYIHRLIMEPSDELTIDHLNGDALDNRRCNLDMCTKSENSSRYFKDVKTSQYIGVYWNKRQKAWRARIDWNGHRFDLGSFATEIEAMKARKKKHAELQSVSA